MYLTGPDAEQAADWLFTTNLSKNPGRVSYTLSLNSKGGIESDVTVTTLEEGGGTLVGPILKVGLNVNTWMIKSGKKLRLGKRILHSGRRTLRLSNQKSPKKTALQEEFQVSYHRNY